MNGEVNQAHETTSEQSDFSSRKISYDIKNQGDSDINESQAQGNKVGINGHSKSQYKPVKISKVIKKKEPLGGSIYS